MTFRSKLRIYGINSLCIYVGGCVLFHFHAILYGLKLSSDEIWALFGIAVPTNNVIGNPSSIADNDTSIRLHKNIYSVILKNLLTAEK